MPQREGDLHPMGIWCHHPSRLLLLPHIMWPTRSVVVQLTRSMVWPTCSMVQPTHSMVRPTCSVVRPTHSMVRLTHRLVQPTSSMVQPTHSLVWSTRRPQREGNLHPMGIWCLVSRLLLLPHVPRPTRSTSAVQLTHLAVQPHHRD